MQLLIANYGQFCKLLFLFNFNVFTLLQFRKILDWDLNLLLWEICHCKIRFSIGELDCTEWCSEIGQITWTWISRIQNMTHATEKIIYSSFQRYASFFYVKYPCHRSSKLVYLSAQFCCTIENKFSYLRSRTLYRVYQWLKNKNWKEGQKWMNSSNSGTIHYFNDCFQKLLTIFVEHVFAESDTLTDWLIDGSARLTCK